MNTPYAPEPIPQAATYDRVSHLANEVAGRLAATLSAETQGEVLFSAADRGRYATDASLYQIMPVGVFVPRSADDVRLALDICRSQQVPIVARGGGTSQCGQTIGAGLVIDYSKYLRNIVAVDVAQGTARVEPGLVLDHLNAALRPHGLWYPVDVSTSAQATLGGMAGNNSCGSRSLAYGNMVHNVIGADVWLADGSRLELGPYATAGGRARALGDFVRALAQTHRAELDAHWPRLLRRVGGYNLDIFDNRNVRPYTHDGSVNLAQLLIGSEGTLALTHTLDLRLGELPRAKLMGVVNFPSFYQAMDSAQHIVKLGEHMLSGSLTAVELVDRTMIELALANPAFAPTMRTALIGQPEAILLVEFSAASKAEILPKIAELVELMGELGLPGSVVQLLDEAAQKNLWEVRKAGLNVMMSLRGDGKPVSFIEDCAVPLEHLAEYTEALSAVFRKHGTRGTWYAHASVGTLHVRPILDMRQAGAHGGAAKMRAIAEEASELVRKFKGAYSGEHGDGLCRGEWIVWQFGARLNEAFAEIKHWFDPDGRLCPQRIINPPRMDDTRLMRFTPNYRVAALRPALDWSAWNVQTDPLSERTTPPGSGGDPALGLAKAVEMCNNNGHCRKFDAGSMCPSYRATRDEQHSPRGRANTLRLALSGQLDGLRGEDALASEAVRAALDLCVNCKGCRRECPTGVDVARLKVEFLEHYKARHGHTLKDRLFGQLPAYAPFAAWLAPLLNLRDRVPLFARLSETLLGLSARRPLPQWRRQHFFKGARPGATRAEVLSAARPVVLFVDTFNGYFEPDNARAAMKVLQAAGYTVHVAGKLNDDGKPLCCGRTYLSAGMVTAARARAQEMLDSLLPFAERGIAIVGLEPSCLLTLRDEFLVMGLGPTAQVVSAQAFLFEEFLAREAGAGRLTALQAKLKPLRQPVLLHGHCHQKAFAAVTPILDVIRMIPEAAPELVESSCCGMGGSFGYDSEHFDISMRMGEAALLPAVRANPEALVVADGTSCRCQIADGTGRQALHAAQLLAGQLR